MKKKLVICIVIIAIIAIAVFACVKFVSNNDDDKTSETSSKVTNDDFIDIDLAKQLHNQLNLGSDFTATGFNKNRDNDTNLYYNFGKNTDIGIEVNEDNKVNYLSVSINYVGSSFDKKELSSCIDQLLSENLFNFNKKEKTEIRSLVVNDDVSKTINGVRIHSYDYETFFSVSFSLD